MPRTCQPEIAAAHTTWGWDRDRPVDLRLWTLAAVPGALAAAPGPRQGVVAMRPGTVSLMPAGLAGPLTRQELAKLLAFLKASRWGAQ